MSSPGRHPDDQQLANFGLGKLNDTDSHWIEEHLDDCDACNQTLANLHDDTFAGVVRSLGDSPVAQSAIGVDVSTPAGDVKGSDSSKPAPTDGAVDRNDSEHAATMLVQSGTTVESTELPAELRNHARYEVVQQVGQGGMGAVYRAQHRLMNRPVALKLINSQLIRHPQAVERFRREVQAAAQLAHPNIVAAYDAEQAGDVHFLAMELVEGTDLSDVVQRRGPLPVTEACEYIRQAAFGLQHAHEKGMVHRDIKPHNLMLSPDGQVRILDFGLAGFATEEAYLESEEASESDGDTAPVHLTTMGSVMGTPDYIAPEQARDAHSADIRADIYSLGCTLFFLLTGKPPFEAGSVVEKLKAHAVAELPKLACSCDDAPAELQDFLNQMLAKDPADRFQSPTEVAEALAPMAGHGTQAALVSEPPRRPLGRYILWSGIVTLLGAVIYIATTKGNFEVRSEVDGVKVTVSRDGESFRVLDVNSGTSLFWLPADGFEVTAKGDTAVTVAHKQVLVNWMGRQIIEVKRFVGAPRANAESNVPSLELSRTLAGHTDSVAAIDISSDGRQAVSSSQDRTMRLWDVQTGQCLHVFGTRIYAGYVDISPDDRFVAIGSPGAGVRIWNLEDYELYRTLTAGNGGVRGLAFSPDSRFMLAVNDDGSVRYWDVENEKVIYSFTLDSEFKYYAGTQISGDGRLGVVRPLTRTGDSTVYLFDLHTGKLQRKLKFKGGGPGTGHIALSKDARELLVPDGVRETTIYDLEKETERQIFTSQVVVSFLPDKRYGVWGGKDGVVSVRDIRTDTLVATSGNHKYSVGGMSVAPDGRVLLTGYSRFSGMPAPNKDTLEEDFAIRIWQLPESVWPTEHDRLQGTWVPVSGHMRTKAITAKQLSNMSITFAGNRVTLTDPDSGQSIPAGTFAVNADRVPQHITLTAPDGLETLPGIFQFDGHQLRLAWNDEDYARPTDFKPAQTPDHITVVLKFVPGSRPQAVADSMNKLAALDEVQQKVLKAAEEFLSVMDEGRFGELFNLSSSWARKGNSREKTSRTHQAIRDAFGKAEQRTLLAVQLLEQDPNLPKGRYAGVQYKSRFERQGVLWETLLLNLDTDGKWRVNTYANTLQQLPLPDHDRARQQKIQAALAAAGEWHKLIDAGKYGESWETSAKMNRDGITQQKMVDLYKELFQPLGPIKTRHLVSNEHKTQMPNAPVGDYVVIQYRSAFTNERVIETVVLTQESDGQWRVSGYFHRGDNSVPTPPATGTNRKRPPGRTGILTNPPTVPESGVPTGKNLIVDPSLEESPPGSLPRTWSAWLDDGPVFQCKVVEGGVTGKRCLQISGTGTRGVVFATSIPMDRTRRYALKGRVKVEGDAGTWAVIKLNYFNKTGWLGVDDRVGVKSGESGWQFFEKTDRAKAFPEATLIVPTCHIEGSGTAWFDDLEVIAYDRDKLPEDFEKKHGKNNRMYSLE